MDNLLSQDEINSLLGGGDAPSGSAGLSMEDTQILNEVASIFSNAENNVFSMLAGKEVNSKGGETEVLSQAEFKAKLGAETPFVFRATFDGFDDVPLIFAVGRRGALALADLMMGGEGKDVPEEASELYLNAAQEGLSQVVGSAFTSLSGLMGGRRLMPENTKSALEEEDDWAVFPALDAEARVWASFSEVEIEGLEPFAIWAAIPLDSVKTMAELIRQNMGGGEKQPESPSLSSSPSPQAPRAAQAAGASPASAPSTRGGQRPGPVTDVRPAEFTPLSAKGPAGSGSKIDLIADIPVRVTVELGKTRKNISEILGMTTGSVIELDKMAGEPVDVLVNGKLIAKGEVVVIDENFGVRVTEVLGAAPKAYAV
ncbi:MAG: flagellar motor switch protein FliN [Synergistaceae bacterium]|jgi:flagellar motor switch protein FliN/FliY|nr:flagellar motor switch protein FliN [Synergistaceae bacterium]